MASRRHVGERQPPPPRPPCPPSRRPPPGMLYLHTMKTLQDLKAVYDLPLPELVFRAMEVHRAHHDSGDVQRCALLSIKTGGCPEDCGYCSQSARYQTGLQPAPLMTLEE